MNPTAIAPILCDNCTFHYISIGNWRRFFSFFSFHFMVWNGRFAWGASVVCGIDFWFYFLFWVFLFKRISEVKIVLQNKCRDFVCLLSAYANGKNTFTFCLLQTYVRHWCFLLTVCDSVRIASIFDRLHFSFFVSDNDCALLWTVGTTFNPNITRKFNELCSFSLILFFKSEDKKVRRKSQTCIHVSYTRVNICQHNPMRRVHFKSFASVLLSAKLTANEYFRVTSYVYEANW